MELCGIVFGGSSTTYRVVEYLGVQDRYILTYLNPIEDYIQYVDATTHTIEQKADLIMWHQPYLDIVKYSDKENDGSNCENCEDFLDWMENVAIKCYNNLNKGGYLILVICNCYKNCEELTLGVCSKDRFCKDNKFKCKSHIIKYYDEIKGTECKKYNLNYVRQLRSVYNNFYGDNIFILKRN